MADVYSADTRTWIQNKKGIQVITDDEKEALVYKARQLTYGMFARTGRLPDYADFRAAFNEADSRPGNTEPPQMNIKFFQNGAGK